MSIDTANRIINEQEEAISTLKHKLLEMENARDLALGQSLELVAAMRRIECVEVWLEDAQKIARKAIDDFQGK